MGITPKPNNRLLRYSLLTLGWWMLFVSSVGAQTATFDDPPINYQTAEVHDPVADLIADMKSGKTKLDFKPEQGYLTSVLDALEIPISSQTLVFSKTSMQIHRITPHRPRAIYFNDEVYVGWCQKGEVLEIASTDANQGPTFYTIEQIPQKSPRIVRDRGQCISCHASNRTQSVPGYLIRSVFPKSSGHPNYGSGTYTTDQTSPFSQRWGGWYVTGTHGGMRHLGNTIFPEQVETQDLDPGANRVNLEGLVSTEPYLSPHSDIVALMVLEHQTQMHNALTAANFETRMALHQSYSMNKILDRSPKFVSETSQRRIGASVERVLEHLLMCREFQLEAPVTGTSQFTREFMELGPHDSNHRSLRDFDLETRLFRYPCSYLIYSPSFDALPDEVRRPIITRLLEILRGQDDSKQFAHLTPELRQSILEILEATKPDLFKQAAE